MAKQAKARIYEQLARMSKTLASPVRIELVDLLAQGERSVESLADEIGASIANTSHHLQVLREARLVDARRAGVQIFYRLSGVDVSGLLQTVRQVAEARLEELDAAVTSYLGDRDGLEPVSRDDLARRARDGLVTILDVRPVLEFEAGHIPGAVSIPIAELARRIADLPKSREIVAYCRGPYCVFAHEAVQLLRKRGRKARRLEDGFPEWRLAGLPVATGTEAAR